jgi:hypothetical protein
MSELYNRSIQASAAILTGDQRQAHSVARAMVAEVDASFRAGEISDAARLAVHGFASDLRAAAYNAAANRHDARKAALKSEFAPAKPKAAR